MSIFRQHSHRCWKYAISILVLSTIGRVQATGNNVPAETCGVTTPPVASKSPQNLRNSAFLFVKPHANTDKVRELVEKKLENEGIKILSRVDIGGEEIDSKGLIDQHYCELENWNWNRNAE